MNDSIIRKAFHSHMIRHCHQDPNTLVVDELGVHHGKARIDIAVINGALTGYEIKSEMDDLSRLESQVEAYSTVFNKLTLIVAEKYSKDSQDLLPKWWGLITVKKGVRSGLTFNKDRIAKNNPQLDNYSVAKLLWKDEAISLLKEFGIKGKILRSNRNVLYENLADLVNKENLQSMVCEILKARQNWRDHLQLS